MSNNDDLNWEDAQVPQEEQVDQVVDEALGEDEQQYEEETQGSDIIEEALERIEQAKLYESLIKHDFFGPGSARKAIQDRVTREIRSFILERLEILLGIRQPKQDQVHIQQVESPFSDEEVDALRTIAGRLIQKGQVNPPEPQVNQFAGGQTEPQPRQTRPVAPRVNQTRPAQQQQPRPAPRKPAGKPLKEKTPEERLADGTYKPQAVSKAHPPKPMPSQQQINQMHEIEVARRQALGPTGINDQILRLAVSASQSINKDVVETLNE